MKNLYLSAFTFLALGFGTSLMAQGENLFNEGIVHEIRLTFEETAFWSTLTGNYDNFYPDIPYIMASANIDGETVDSIGVRLKGFASYWVNTDKKSIKLDFNEFVAGKKYDGLKKVNLNNGEGDPALQRDIICYDLMRQSGVNAPRTSYAKVYLNDQYWGLYILVEQVDKTFLQGNFSDDTGNLFKNMGNSNLEWLGADPAPYQNVFELKTGDDPTAAWERFVNLMDVINNGPAASFKEDISAIFDVDRYLRVLAVDVATNNWDSYIEHGRNFYMYENPQSQKFQWIPWDYNFAIGGNFSSGGGDGGSGGEGPDPTTCVTILNGSSPYPASDTIFIQVINIDAFCCDTEWDGVCQGLYDDLADGNGGSGPPPNVTTFPIDMSSSEKILIQRLLAVDEFQERYYQYWCALLDQNLNSDRISPMIETRANLIREFVYDDPNYMWTTEDFEADLGDGNTIPGLGAFIEERPATLTTELAGLYDCGDLISQLQPMDIVINEFMASNDTLSGISDLAGEYDDWVELYNNTDEAIDLSNAYLSDDINNPQLWAFPSGTTIAANGYLIIWADNDVGQEGLHASFKLSRQGESLVLSDYDLVLDDLTFEEQTTNMTASRIPNGTGNFSIQAPTFNSNNDAVTATDDHLAQVYNINIYPNPASDYINISFNNDTALQSFAHLYNSMGQEVRQLTLTGSLTKIDVQNLSPGIYFLSLEDGNRNLFYRAKIRVSGF